MVTVFQRRSDDESTRSELRWFKFPPSVLLFCASLLCVWVGGATAPIGSGDFSSAFYWMVKLGHGPTDPWEGGGKLNYPICMHDDVMNLVSAAGSVRCGAEKEKFSI